MTLLFDRSGLGIPLGDDDAPQVGAVLAGDVLPGWLALMVAMGCLPTGTLTLALAIAKLIGDRRR